MGGEDEAALLGERGKVALETHVIVTEASSDSAVRRQLHVGPGIDEGAQRRDAVGRRDRRRRETGVRHVADIAVTGELRPGPAFVALVDGDRLAEQRLGVEGSVGTRLAPHRRRGGRDTRSECRPRSGAARQPALEGAAARSGRAGVTRRSRARSCGNAFACATIRSPSRSTAKAPLTVRWTMTLRRSASSRRRDTSSSLPMRVEGAGDDRLGDAELLASPRTVCGGVPGRP